MSRETNRQDVIRQLDAVLEQPQPPVNSPVSCYAQPATLPLHWASRWGLSDYVDRLIHAGADVNRTGREKMTALHCTASSGIDDGDSLGVIRLLVANGANLEARSHTGRLPIHYAAFYSSPAIVEALSDDGRLVNDKQPSGATPLHGAASGQKLDNVEKLLSMRANPTVADRAGDLPLHSALQQNCSKELIERLANHNGRRLDQVNRVKWQLNPRQYARSIKRVTKRTGVDFGPLSTVTLGLYRQHAVEESLLEQWESLSPIQPIVYPTHQTVIDWSTPARFQNDQYLEWLQQGLLTIGNAISGDPIVIDLWKGGVVGILDHESPGIDRYPRATFCEQAASLPAALKAYCKL